MLKCNSRDGESRVGLSSLLRVQCFYAVSEKYVAILGICEFRKIIVFLLVDKNAEVTVSDISAICQNERE